MAKEKKTRKVNALSTLKTTISKAVDFETMSLAELEEFELKLNELNDLFNKAQKERGKELLAAEKARYEALKAKFGEE